MQPAAAPTRRAAVAQSCHSTGTLVGGFVHGGSTAGHSVAVVGGTLGAGSGREEDALHRCPDPVIAGRSWRAPARLHSARALEGSHCQQQEVTEQDRYAPGDVGHPADFATARKPGLTGRPERRPTMVGLYLEMDHVHTTVIHHDVAGRPAPKPRRWPTQQDAMGELPIVDQQHPAGSGRRRASCCVLNQVPAGRCDRCGHRHPLSSVLVDTGEHVVPPASRTRSGFDERMRRTSSAPSSKAPPGERGCALRSAARFASCGSVARCAASLVGGPCKKAGPPTRTHGIAWAGRI